MKKLPWYLLQFGALALLGGCIPLGLAVGLPLAGWLVLAAALGLHIYELKISLPLGCERHLRPALVVIKTLLFGFTWWLPLKKGVFTS